MPKVLLFDIGMNQGRTSLMFVNSFNNIGVEYEIHGFEPMVYLCDIAKKRFKDNENIFIYNCALTDSNGKAKVYFCRNNVGHSIFEDHAGIKKGLFQEVDSYKFSDWLIENIGFKRLEENYVILKVNAEGAEYHIFKDLFETKMIKYFKIVTGDDFSDIDKIKSIENGKKFREDIFKILYNYNIFYYRITRFRGANMMKVRRRIRRWLDGKIETPGRIDEDD